MLLLLLPPCSFAVAAPAVAASAPNPRGKKLRMNNVRNGKIAILPITFIPVVAAAAAAM